MPAASFISPSPSRKSSPFYIQICAKIGCPSFSKPILSPCGDKAHHVLPRVYAEDNFNSGL
ncbi:hypothetical protein SLEP1_g5951 [Rubroshorea leprosula]|uniref:Uncharacterized protein n=1 Tax=Rubroshorea leprosula TaxID=152421 RepID=A0AAV5I2G9_9ROSI|nr:hypothetical protein SLEP1_g5951 [Rubroshorea leprosula]